MNNWIAMILKIVVKDKCNKWSQLQKLKPRATLTSKTSQCQLNSVDGEEINSIDGIQVERLETSQKREKNESTLFTNLSRGHTEARRSKHKQRFWLLQHDMIVHRPTSEEIVAALETCELGPWEIRARTWSFCHYNSMVYSKMLSSCGLGN